MKNVLLTVLLLFACLPILNAQSTKITIEGKVQFPYNQFKMEIYERDGFGKNVVDSFTLAEDGTYKYTMEVKKPGRYTLDCQKWQSVDFWAEDEDLKINFRGYDTAKVKIKNPPYVHIFGGDKNEVLNLLNFNSYRNYQRTIAVGKEMYAASKSDSKEWNDFAADLYGQANNDFYEQVRFIVRYYSDRNSILAVLPLLRSEADAELVAQTLSTLEKKNPNYAPLVTYKNNIAEAKKQKERLAEGKQAPLFQFPTPDGKKIGPKDFKGKYLLIDFWASWCGPCRNSIPHLKEVYEEYKDKGVEILSVSIDKDEKAWRKAMSEESMPWPQALAPGAGKEIMKEYQFSGIPYIILVDKQGNIVEKRLHGEAINEALNKVLPK